MPAGIERKYKTFVQRLAALIIDGIVFLPVSLLINSVIDGNGTMGFIVRTVLFNVTWVGYSAWMHGKYGQTLGKMASNIKVYSLDEKSLIGYDKALLRETILLGVSFVGLIYVLIRGADSNDPETIYNDITTYPSLVSAIVELVTMFTNSKRRALHDFIAGSVVLDITKYKKWDFEYEEPVGQTSDNSQHPDNA